MRRFIPMFSLFLSPAAFAQTYAIIPIPGTPQATSTDLAASALGVNSSGRIVGSVETAVAITTPVEWVNLTMTPLAPPAGAAGDGTAFSVSDANVIAGTELLTGGVTEIVTWTGGVPTTLGTPPLGGGHAVRAISSSGVVIGTTTTPPFPGALTIQPWVFDGTSITALVPPPGALPADLGLVFDISTSDEIVGLANIMGRSRAATWKRDPAGTYTQPPVLLPPLSTVAGSLDVALGIDSFGNIVGSSVDATGLTRAVMWNGLAAPTPLGMCPAGVAGSAGKINDAGEIVGFCGTGPASTLMVGSTSGFSSLLGAATPGHGWSSLDSLIDLTNSGLILGSGTRNSGSSADFLAVPLSSPLLLSDPDPGMTAVPNTITLSGAPAFANVAFVQGTPGGTTPMPTCPGSQFDLGGATVLGFAVADAAGTATLTATIPTSLKGVTTRIQGAEQTTCTKSNVMTAFWE